MPTALTHQHVKLIASLQQRKGRLQHGLFVAEGPRLVDELLRSHLRVAELLYLPQWRHPLMGHAQRCAEIGERDMQRISGLSTPTEVLAVVELPPSTAVASPSGLMLALDTVQDPGNLGTIIRLASWFGVEQVVCSPSTADAYAPKVVQSSMGAIARVRIAYHPLPEVLPSLGVPIYGTFMQGESIYTAPVQLPAVVVMGNEGNGIGPEVERLVHRRLHIPSLSTQGSSVESLNVAMATAIVCSELLGRPLRG